MFLMKIYPWSLSAGFHKYTETSVCVCVCVCVEGAYVGSLALKHFSRGL